jgi:hypothetical protein
MGKGYAEVVLVDEAVASTQHSDSSLMGRGLEEPGAPEVVESLLAA